MNQYSELLRYIKKLGEDDVFINTVTQGNFSRIDLDKGNIFPLLHTTVLSAEFNNGATIVFNVEIAALQQRDTNKEINTDKFTNNDNQIDNLNEMLAVLNRLWLVMYTDFEDKGFIASENPSLDIIEPETQTNSIEGWRMVFNIEMPNEEISLC